ncbi:MAG: hypothetical protein JSS96_11170, partial [Bacteroidetes bacterium]|nr:hypothetical protein [Bacteroidota bacterium]
MSSIDDKGFKRHFSAYYVILFCLPFFIACHSHSKNGTKERVIASAPDSKEFAEKLSTIFPDVDTAIDKNQLRSIAGNMRFAYELNEYAPVWLSSGKPNKASEKLLDELDSMRWDGINPEKYHLSQLRQLREGFKSDNTDINYLINFDTTFTNSYLLAAHDLLMGELVPKTVDTLWYHKNDTAWAAPQHIAAKDADFPSLDAYRSKVSTYTLLRDQYRFYTGLQGDSQLM